MALNQDTLVEMPAHCVRAKKNGAVYIQYTIRAYRNEKGKPTSERVSIGKEDPETGMLIPNRNYYEYVEKRKQIELPAFVRSCGIYAAFSGVTEKLGLKKLLEKQFGQDRAAEILTVSHYMMLQGNVMLYLSDWLEENVSFGGTHLTSAGTSRLFSGITENERICFFNDWMKQRKNGEYLAYDVTSISSYGKNMESLSFISLYKHCWKSQSYAAACGVSDRVLWQMLKDGPHIQKVYLCLDNDEAGQKAAGRISAQLTEKGITNELLVPERKDWNEELLHYRKGEAVSKVSYILTSLLSHRRLLLL